MSTDLSLNHVGEQFQLTIGGTPVALTLPTYRDPATGTMVPITPSHMIVYTDKTVRWRADGVDPTPDMGMVFLAGTRESWIEPLTDFSGMIQCIKFVKDALTSGNATLEIAFFT